MLNEFAAKDSAATSLAVSVPKFLPVVVSYAVTNLSSSVFRACVSTAASTPSKSLPPVIVSLPVAPVTVSVVTNPAPVNVSTTLPPAVVSLPVAPVTVSLPVAPVTLPVLPDTMLVKSLTVAASSPAPPVSPAPVSVVTTSPPPSLPVAPTSVPFPCNVVPSTTRLVIPPGPDVLLLSFAIPTSALRTAVGLPLII